MKELQVEFKFNARYYKSGEINAQTREVWFVLHGYGQLAGYFIQKFSTLEKQKTCVIAPEGLSRFYLEDITTRMNTGNNRVGATWMTRENRLMDIENYIEFLTAIYSTELKNYPEISVTLLGFSQGAATVCRWALDPRIRYRRLILWAGLIPPDMDVGKGKEILSDKDVIFVYGDRDPYLTEDRLTEMKGLSEKLGVVPKTVVFNGEHDIHPETLIQLNSPS